MKLKLILFSFIYTLLFTVANAQPTLPEAGVMTKGGINILSWTNPYTTGVTEVLLERAKDSNAIFSLVGNVADISKPAQYYVDAYPFPGENYYRVIVMLSDGSEWKSNIISIYVNPNDLAVRNVLPSNDSIQKLVLSMGVVPTDHQLNQISYTPSPYVFTNPFNGNINIELEDALSVSYKLIFYDEQNKEVLAIPRINDNNLVLDKRNFMRNGLYNFKLFKNNQEFADGKVAVY